MENQKNDNLNLLEAVVQNTEMGKNTLEQIVPMTEEPRFKAELLRQRNIYRELNQEARTAITACGGTAQGQSTMAKLNTKMGISMKSAASDVYKRQINPPGIWPKCSPRGAARASWTASNPRKTTRTPRPAPSG